jgi:hypothetical protein
MKLARLFLAVVTAATLGACSDSVTAPEAQPATVAPANNNNDYACTGTITYQTLANGSIVVLCNGMPGMGSGG